jgi:hypothetical protein
MQAVLTMLTEFGYEFGLSAEIAHMITHIRHYERLTGECSGVGTILDWMETAVKDLSELANVFHPSSQTAEHFRYEAARLRSYVGRLRALGFLPVSPLSIHEPPADGGRD